jgi:hypothetical protein
MSPLRSLAEAFWTKREKLAPLVAVAGIALVASQLVGSVPREVHLRYDLGPDHAALEEVRVGYLEAGEELTTARFDYARGAPAAIDHRVTLSPGRYEVVVDLRGDGALTGHGVRTFEVPADGIVRVRLFEAGAALAAAP